MNNYHDWVYYTLVTVSILSIISIIWSIIVDNAEVFVSMCIISTFVFLIGWLIIGNQHEVQSVTTTCNGKIITTPTSIILTVDDKPIKTITDVATYTLLKDKTNIDIRQEGWINIYGTTNWENNYLPIIQ